MKYKSPKNYSSTVYLTLMKLTFVDYKYTINVCYDNQVNKEWRETNVKLYCAVSCMNKHRQDKILQHTDNCLALQSSFILSEKKTI